MEAQQPEGNGCNDGMTPQEQQTEAQQPEGNGYNNGTTPQEQQIKAQQPEGNRYNDGTTPQEQQMESQEPEGNEEQMYLFWMMNPIILKLNLKKTLSKLKNTTANEITSPSDGRLKLQRLL